MQYSLTKGLVKSIIPTVIVGLPLVIGLLPQEWQNLTLSGAVLLLVNFLKVKYGN